MSVQTIQELSCCNSSVLCAIPNYSRAELLQLIRSLRDIKLLTSWVAATHPFSARYQTAHELSCCNSSVLCEMPNYSRAELLQLIRSLRDTKLLTSGVAVTQPFSARHQNSNRITSNIIHSLFRPLKSDIQN